MIDQPTFVLLNRTIRPSVTKQHIFLYVKTAVFFKFTGSVKQQNSYKKAYCSNCRLRVNLQGNLKSSRQRNWSQREQEHREVRSCRNIPAGLPPFLKK